MSKTSKTSKPSNHIPTTDRKLSAQPILDKEIAIEHKLTELEVIDTILTSKLAGEINGYRNLLTDTTVIGTWTQRQSALVQMERQVVPADPDNQADVEAAQFVATQINNIGFDNIIKAMQWGVYYGYAVAEVIWQQTDGKIGIADIKVRDRGKFKYDKDQRLVFLGNDAETVVAERKFWTYSAGGDTTDNPYGLGLAHYLFWAVLFKKSNIKFWLLGLEKAATSVPHVQYDPKSPNAASERQKALQAGISIKNGSAIATAQGTVVELLKGVSGTEDYETLCRYMDEAIALVILGQVMTSQAVGGQYKAEIQNQVKEDIIKADADLIFLSSNITVAKWLTEWNFPNAKPPKLWLLTQSEIDKKATADTYNAMATVGYRPTLDTVQETFGGKWEVIPSAHSLNQPDTNKQNPQTNTNNSQPTDFAEGNDTDNQTKNNQAKTSMVDTSMVDDMVNQLAQTQAPYMKKWLDKLNNALDKATSLEDLQDQLNEMADELDFDDYAQVFAQANLAAKLAGMQSVQSEAQHDS